MKLTIETIKRLMNKINVATLFFCTNVVVRKECLQQYTLHFMIRFYVNYLMAKCNKFLQFMAHNYLEQ